MAVVNWAIRAALQEFASSDDPFDEWLKERGGRSTTSNRARSWKLIRRSSKRRSARGDGTSSVMQYYVFFLKEVAG
jgi:hypothetical protein